MEHFAGLDVSVKDTSVCIVGDTGKPRDRCDEIRPENWPIVARGRSASIVRQYRATQRQ